MKNTFSGRLPETLTPMLASPGAAFDSDKHFFEIKWDGIRTLAYIDEGGYRLINRKGADMTVRYPEFAFLAELPAGTILDGEMVVLENGKPDFGLLMTREQARTAVRIRNAARARPATYIVFDLLYLDFRSIMDEPFRTRRQRLTEFMRERGRANFVLSDGVIGPGTAFFREVTGAGLEGIVAKRLDSRYLPGQRQDAWIKVKRGRMLCCAIIGFVPSGKDDFRNLLVAIEEEGRLRYVGKVGTGFDMAMRKKLNQLLWSRLRSRPITPCEIKGKWIEPGLYCQVSCLEITRSGHMRSAAFEALVE
jgi:DNA ligase D-like protein (predicted ligase)